jgi:Tol biopolymer transport system component
VEQLLFSPDSQHLAYAAEVWKERRGKRFVVLDGEPGPEHEGVGMLVFSPDSKHLAYQAMGPRSGEWAVVLDGEPGPKYRYVGAPVFSPDGRHLAYCAQFAHSGDVVVVDGQQGPVYSQVSQPAFSPESQHLAYWACWWAGGRYKAAVVLDGCLSPECDAVLGHKCLFRRDGTLEFLALKDGVVWRVRRQVGGGGPTQT